MAGAGSITPSEAVELAEEEYEVSVTTETVYTWCEKYNIGRKVGGRWYVNKKRLILLLEGRTWESMQEAREIDGKRK